MITAILCVYVTIGLIHGFRLVRVAAQVVERYENGEPLYDSEVELLDYLDQANKTYGGRVVLGSLYALVAVMWLPLMIYKFVKRGADQDGN